jgi:hypothetical protein
MAAQGQNQNLSQGQERVANGRPPALPNGAPASSLLQPPPPPTSQSSQPPSLLATPPARRLVYNRVSPLLPPLPQEGESRQGGVREGEGKEEKPVPAPSYQSVMDVKSISSWGGDTTPRDPPDTGRDSQLLSARSGQAGAGRDADAASFLFPAPLDREARDFSPRVGDIELGGMAGPKTRQHTHGVRDVETGRGVESAHTQSQTPPPHTPASSEGSPHRHRRHKKKKSKGDKRSREGTPKKSPSHRRHDRDDDDTVDSVVVKSSRGAGSGDATFA